MARKQAPRVVVVGRVNVGKSTFVNKCAEGRPAIVSSIPGTTRDYLESQCIWRGQSWTLIDTGGFEFRSSDPLHQAIRQQTQRALQNADAIVFLVDGRNDLHPLDRDIARFLQKQKTPVILGINKIDSQKDERNVSPDFFRLPFSETHFISSTTGRGIGDFLDAIDAHLLQRRRESSEGQQEKFTLGLFGKPNVGKSSLINAILHEPRVIVDSRPHTTRDPQQITFSWHGRAVTVVDTAGLARRPRVLKNSTLPGRGKLTWNAIQAGEKWMRRVDVAAFILDVSENLTAQDLRIASDLEAAQKPLIILANKWDLIPGKKTHTLPAVERTLRNVLPPLHDAPILLVSATQNIRIQDILQAATDLLNRKNTRLSSEEVEKIQKHLFRDREWKQARHDHPSLFFRQSENNPLLFEIITHRKIRVSVRMINAVMKILRSSPVFRGLPLQIDLRRKEDVS